jgi:hypothetical protein
MQNRWIVLCLAVLGVVSAQNNTSDHKEDFEKLYTAIRAKDLPRLKTRLSQGIGANSSDVRR